MTENTPSDAMVEAMARALAKADNIEICSDAQYRYSSYGIRAQAAAAVIAEAMAAAVIAEAMAAKDAELEAFKQKVSEAIQNYKADCDYKAYMAPDRFIIPKPDPLVEAITEWRKTPGSGEYCTPEQRADTLRAALAKHGLKLERIEHE